MQHIRTLCAVALLAAPALAQSCLFSGNTPPGLDLQLSDDQTRVFPLPFPFPFNGGVVTEIGICSNGYVWLTNNTLADFSESEAEFLSQDPRVALCWEDWNPGSGGAVFYNVTATQASVVYQNVPQFGNSAVVANMELVLSVTGGIDLHYDAAMGVHTGTPIVGVSAGLGATANPITWTPPPASVTGGVSPATGYQLFLAGAFNLTGTTTSLIPVSATDWTAINIPLGPCPPTAPPTFAAATSYGTGCPTAGANAGAFYEQFASGTFDLSNTSHRFVLATPTTFVLTSGGGFDTGYSPADALTQTDDSQVNVSLAAMGGFPWMGGLLQSVDCCSNGFLWMSPNPSNDFSATGAELAAEDARIAPCWSDWNLSATSPTGGGTFYWTATSNFCMATWENVGAFGVAGASNTFQCKLFANGDVEFNYGSVLNNATTGSGIAVVGMANGPGANDPGSIDLGSLMVGHLVDLTVVRPLVQTALGVPSLGGGYGFAVADVPAGTALGAFALGFTQLGVELSALGMPGCYQHTTTDAVIVRTLAPGATTMSFNFTVPFSQALMGVVFLSQGATFSAGFNPRGIVTSNGIRSEVGF